MKKPSLIRITKQFRFEAAHALWNYDGLCRNIHGHSYVLYVTIIGHPISDHNHTKLGMVMDFSELKKIVQGKIIDRFDHSLLINANTPHAELARDNRMFGKVVALPYQPTCENMITDFAECIQQALPEYISLHSLRLHETNTAFAEWYADDNK
jgi:6-pyruvoyltetrahydropterin/6-carboxytetrahydropterin synthase